MIFFFHPPSHVHSVPNPHILDDNTSAKRNKNEKSTGNHNKAKQRCACLVDDIYENQRVTLVSYTERTNDQNRINRENFQS